MKIKIRNGVFETNSSSVHTICIRSNINDKIPEEIELDNDFPCGGIKTFQEKANYVFAMCVAHDLENPSLCFETEKHYCQKFIAFLENAGIKVTVKKYEEYYPLNMGGYDDFLETIINNENLLTDFIFNNNSFVVIRDNNYADFPLTGEELESFKSDFKKFQFCG